MFAFFVLVAIQVASVILCVITVKRLYAYLNKYKFDESVYTLLFGILRLRYFVYNYIFAVAFTSIVGFIYAFAYLVA